MVRLPDTVSMTFAPLMPIWTPSITAPVDAVTIPEKLPCFHCLELSPKSYVAVVLGNKPEINSPPTLISSPVLSPRLIVPPLNVATPTNSEYPWTLRLPPTVRFLLIPTPPSICTAPVSALPNVLSVVSVKVTMPEKELWLTAAQDKVPSAAVFRK